MAEHDSAEAYELVGILLPWRLRFISHKKNKGIYRDDGIIPLLKLKQANRMRKGLTKLFKNHKLNISTNNNAKMINFLDVSLDLSKGLYKQCTKDS